MSNESTKSEEPFKFQSADERIAWDRFAEGFLSKGDIRINAATGADEMIKPRRQPGPGHRRKPGSRRGHRKVATTDPRGSER